MQRSDHEAPVGNYGQDWKAGVLSEHLRHGHVTHRLPAGTLVVIQPNGTTNRVVCSELIWVFTEDGRIDGRCGRPVDQSGLTCPRHELPSAEDFDAQPVPFGYDI